MTQHSTAARPWAVSTRMVALALALWCGALSRVAWEHGTWGPYAVVVMASGAIVAVAEWLERQRARDAEARARRRVHLITEHNDGLPSWVAKEDR